MVSLPDSLCAGAVHLPLSCFFTHLQYLPQELRRTGKVSPTHKRGDESPTRKRGTRANSAGKANPRWRVGLTFASGSGELLPGRGNTPGHRRHTWTSTPVSTSSAEGRAGPFAGVPHQHAGSSATGGSDAICGRYLRTASALCGCSRVIRSWCSIRSSKFLQATP